MTRTYRANRLHPVILSALLAGVVYFLVRDFDPDRLARTVAAATFVLAIAAQGILLFFQTEFEIDETGFSYRERRLLHASSFRRMSLADLERVRIKGRLVRIKTTDGDAVIVKLGFLAPTDRKEIMGMFRKLPQYVDDPFAEARVSMPKRSE